MRDLERKLHQTIIKVTDDMENFRFNTAIAAMMELNNMLIKVKESAVVGSPIWNDAVRCLTLMMAPIFPHISRGTVASAGQRGQRPHCRPGPGRCRKGQAEDEITVVVQVNGKVRDKIQAPADIDDAGARQLAMASEAVQRHLDGEPRKVIYVPGRLINIVA